MTKFQPYLFFGGNAREAFTRYQEIFGGQLDLVSNLDMPPEERMDGVDDDVIMHANLAIGDGALMGSDDPTSDPFPPPQSMRVYVELPTMDEATKAFDALAEGGEVHMPLSPTSWAPAFGMLADRFGTPWMISVDAPIQDI
jgi:PhnB protein